MSKPADIEPGSKGVVFSGQGVTNRSDIYNYLAAVAEIDKGAVDRNLKAMMDVSQLPLAMYREKRDETVLGNTLVVQTLLGVAHLAAIDILRIRIPDLKGVRLVAGHSSGEMAAKFLAGMYKDGDRAPLIADRGLIMHDAAQARPSGLFLPLGLDRETAEKVVFETRQKLKPGDGEVVALALANDTSVNVIGATQQTLVLVKGIALNHRVRRIIPIDSEGAWHTPVFDRAGRLFGVKLEATPHNFLRFPISLNDGSITTDPTNARLSHVDRFTNTSEWTSAVREFLGLETVIMVGPGGKIIGFNEANGFQPSQLVSFFDFAK